MAILVLDTSLIGLLLGLADDSGELREAIWYEKPQDAAAKLPMLCADLLTKQGLDLSDVKKLIVGKGPGSFTGIKIGLAFGRGLTLSAPNIEAKGVSAFYSFFSERLGDGEIAVLPSTSNSAYYLQKKKAAFECGLLREENNWLLEVRAIDGDLLSMREMNKVSTIHAFSEFSNLNSTLKQHLIGVKWMEYSLKDEVDSIVDSMLKNRMSFIDEHGFNPIYMKKSAPEEKVVFSSKT